MRAQHDAGDDEVLQENGTSGDSNPPVTVAASQADYQRFEGWNQLQGRWDDLPLNTDELRLLQKYLKGLKKDTLLRHQKV